MDSPTSPGTTRFIEVDATLLEPVIVDLGLELDRITTPSSQRGSRDAAALLLAISEATAFEPELGEALAWLAGAELAEDGILLCFLEGRRTDRELAALRNSLWPLLHASALYHLKGGDCLRRTLGGVLPLEGAMPETGTVLAACRRTHALSPETTIEKFDQNASGWNGEPGAPGYPHFRWMRRFVACFTPIAQGGRILDFGCGAGWCGIEAASRFGASELAFFDPSPEMVRIAEHNAREAGVANASGRTGFGETPPFPADGEAPFDAVISSGVISFAPDPERWLDGLVGTVAPGGTLVIGDLHRDSRGNRRRRTLKPLLPGRELNASTPATVRARLETRGFRCLSGCGYQLTRPFPEAMHVSETKLHGLLTWPLLWSNQLLTTTGRRLGFPGQDQFDSWVMCLERERT